MITCQLGHLMRIPSFGKEKKKPQNTINVYQFYFSVEKTDEPKNRVIIQNIPKIKKKGDKECLLDTFVVVLKKDTDALNGRNLSLKR